MKAQTKFIIKVVAVVFIAAVLAFYIFKIRSGGREAASFVALKYKWGIGDTLQNSYNSQTGAYHFIDQNDSLINENFKLRINNIIYLHSKIREDELLAVPDTIANSLADLTNDKILRYEFELVYDDTTRKIVYLSNYDRNPKIADKARKLQQLIFNTILEAEERFVNK